MGSPTVHAPKRPAGQHAGSVIDDDRRRRQTADAERRQRAKQYWPIRRASNNTVMEQISITIIETELYDFLLLPRMYLMSGSVKKSVQTIKY